MSKQTGFGFSFHWTPEAQERWQKDGRWEKVDQALAQLLALVSMAEYRSGEVHHEIKAAE